MSREDAKGKASQEKNTKVTSATPPLEATEHKGGLLIRDLWHNGTDSVHLMRVVNTDAKYHLENPLEKFLQEAERAKKRMYLDSCLQQRRYFSPFFACFAWIAGSGGDSNPEKVSQSPVLQMAATLI